MKPEADEMYKYVAAIQRDVNSAMQQADEAAEIYVTASL